MYTEHEKQVMKEASNDLRKAIKIIDELDGNLGYVLIPHNSIIRNCNSILSEIAEDLLQKSREELA